MDPATSALLTDLYQLNMMQAYLDRGETKTASFEFFVRKLPRQRGFLIAAGLEQVLEFLSHLRFAPEELDWLARTGFHTVDFNDVRAYFAGTRPLPTKPVVITFDDGYADLYSAAFPILAEHDFKAVAYIVSGFLGWPGYVTADQVVQLWQERPDLWRVVHDHDRHGEVLGQ